MVFDRRICSGFAIMLPPIRIMNLTREFDIAQVINAGHIDISVRRIRSSCDSLYTSTKYAEKPAIRTTRS